MASRPDSPPKLFLESCVYVGALDAPADERDRKAIEETANTVTRAVYDSFRREEYKDYSHPDWTSWVDVLPPYGVVEGAHGCTLDASLADRVKESVALAKRVKREDEELEALAREDAAYIQSVAVDYYALRIAAERKTAGVVLSRAAADDDWTEVQTRDCCSKEYLAWIDAARERVRIRLAEERALGFDRFAERNPLSPSPEEKESHPAVAVLPPPAPLTPGPPPPLLGSSVREEFFPPVVTLSERNLWEVVTWRSEELTLAQRIEMARKRLATTKRAQAAGGAGSS